MNNLNQHRYIKILKFGYENEYFTQQDMEKYSGVSRQEFTELNKYIFLLKQPNTSPSALYSLKYDAIINYLEYIELQEARQSSDEAKSLSIKAIIISGALALFSIGLSVWQMNSTSTVKLNQDTINAIQSNLKQDQSYEVTPCC